MARGTNLSFVPLTQGLLTSVQNIDVNIDVNIDYNWNFISQLEL